MTKEEKQKIEGRVARLKQEQMNVKAEVGQRYQAIHELTDAFSQLQSRIEELQTLVNPPKKGGK